MKFQRYLNHPVFRNPRSQFIFMTFFIVVGLLSGVLAGMTKMFLEELGVDVGHFAAQGSLPILIFISPLTHVVFAIMGAIVGCVLTGTYVVGPFKRLEDWITSYQAGMESESFQFRKGDEIFHDIILLIKRHVESRSSKKKN